MPTEVKIMHSIIKKKSIHLANKVDQYMKYTHFSISQKEMKNDHRCLNLLTINK